MQFPSLGSIVGERLGSANGLPPYVIVPRWERSQQYQESFRSAFLGPDYAPMLIRDPSKEGFEVTDLSLPKSVAPAAVENRRAFLDVVDRMYRDRVNSAEHARMDAFTQKAWEMLLTPGVRNAFDLSKESEKTKDAYGRDSVGQSLLLARRLVEAGTRFVTAAGFHGNSWDTHSFNDKGHRDRLTPPLDHSLSALIDDMSARGLYDEVIVVVMGEFGRTPNINSRLGRDHWPTCWSAGHWRRRLEDRPDRRQERRKGRLRRRAQDQHRRPLRNHLQGPRHRLDPRVHDPRGPPHQDRQLLRRRHRRARPRTGLVQLV